MSAPVDVTRETLPGLVQDSEILLLDFWAEWCGPCRSFAPVFERAAQANPDVVFGKVDTEAERDLAAAFDISSIPTLVAVKDRTVVFAQAGALPPAALDDLLRQLRALDVEAARSAPEVGLDELADALDRGELVLDVREPHEHAARRVDGVRHVPLGQLGAVVEELPRDRPVYILCEHGARSLEAARALRQAGVDARSVAGGTAAWADAGRPVVSG